MFLLGEVDPPQDKRDLALKAKSDHKSKKKNKCKVPSPSSSEDEANEDSSDEDGDVELALLMRKTSKMMSRLNKRGYNYDPKKNKFRTRKSKDNVKKVCYNCGKYGHLSYDCPEPSKLNKKQEDGDNQYKTSKKSYEKKDHKKKGSFTRKEKVKAFLGEWITDGESSNDDSSDEESKKKIVGIAMHDDEDDGDEAPLPPPPMCFMARGNSKVSDNDDSSSDESEHCLSPNEVQNILDEYQQVIKKYKSKCKVLEIEYAKLKASNNELIVRHNEVVETHDTSIVPSKQLKEEHDKLLVKHDELNVKYEEVVVLNKSLTSCNKKLKLDYANLNMMYQELDFAFDALDEELKETQKKVIKVNIATSCDDLVELPHPIPCHHASPSCSKTNHDREKQLEEELESMSKCMFNVTRGEYLHKEILFLNARHFRTNGLGSFPNPPENCPKSPELMACFNKEVGSYCQHCQVTGHHTRECPIPTRPPPTLPPNYKQVSIQ